MKVNFESKPVVADTPPPTNRKVQLNITISSDFPLDILLSEAEVWNGNPLKRDCTTEELINWLKKECQNNYGTSTDSFLSFLGDELQLFTSDEVDIDIEILEAS